MWTGGWGIQLSVGVELAYGSGARGGTLNRGAFPALLTPPGAEAAIFRDRSLRP
jgi:hypothetical protein